MITALLILAIVSLYFGIGFGYIAPRWVTREVAAHLRDYPHTAQVPGEIERWRREAAGFAIPLATVWPFYLAGRVVTGWISDAAPLTDYELKAENERQAEYIAHLERELGVGPETT